MTALAVLSGLLILLVTVVAALKNNVVIPRRFAIGAPFGHKAKGVFLSLCTVTFYQVLNVVPRFIDRAYASEFQEGVIAAFDYSYGIIIAIAAILGTSFNTVMLPEFVRLVELDSSWTDYGNTIKGAVAIVVLTIFLGGGLAFFAEEIVQLVFVRGNFTTYGAILTSSLLRWHAVGLCFMIIGTITTQVLIVYGAHRRLLLVGFLKVLIKVVSLLILVPLYGMVGLGISFVCVETAMAVFLLFFAVTVIRGKYKNAC